MEKLKLVQFSGIIFILLGVIFITGGIILKDNLGIAIGIIGFSIFICGLLLLFFKKQINGMD